MYNKILVPLDGSPLAEAVLSHVEALANLEGAEVTLLMVAVYPVAEFAFSDPNLVSDILDTLEAETLNYIQSIRTRLQRAGIRTSILVREGSVAETILDVCSEIHADLIAMSTHGRSGVSRWLLGSVADRIINHSPVPVLLIRPQPE